MNDWQDQPTSLLFEHHADEETQQMLTDMHLHTLGAVWEFVEAADADHDALPGTILAVAAYVRTHPLVPQPNRPVMPEELERATTDDIWALDATIRQQEQDLAQWRKRRDEAVETLLNLMALSRGRNPKDGAHAALWKEL